MLILGIWIQDLDFLSKARKLCKPAQVGRETFLLGQFLKNRVQEHDMGIESEISLYRSSFLALVMLLQTWGFQPRFPALSVSWMPFDNFPWDFPQATVSEFAF